MDAAVNSRSNWIDETGMEPVVLPDPPRLSLLQKARWHLKALRPPRRSAWPAMPYPTVELSYWMPDGAGQAVNFGDELSRTVVELMMARRGATLLDSAEPRQLLAVGSVLHMARQNAVIWGAGLHGTMPAREHRYRGLDVRAVRGPVTQRYLEGRGIDVPRVFGDPALLLPILTGDRFRPSGVDEVGFVPNLHDMAFLRTNRVSERYPDLRIIDPLRAWDVVVGEITRCRRIIASSLHGLVTAEAFGIPTRYVRLTENEAKLKYYDYYNGTGRPLAYSTSIEEALGHGGTVLEGYDPEPLMRAFPYDLWGL